MSALSQPWPALAAAIVLCAGCDDLFNLVRVDESRRRMPKPTRPSTPERSCRWLPAVLGLPAL